ncbi:hypothetical protein CU098_010797 [Rhizopus stolonifer]|uniref:Uncharacterized protein n=1 Tax=Rhizopus stolonifer TaxID=4846 RepID=A0A367KIE4_RHIST|nr:hypothetical protein CU098_010797 [Rhizopus stolonifer]
MQSKINDKPIKFSQSLFPQCSPLLVLFQFLHFTFRAVIGDETFIDDPMDTDEDPLFMDNSKDLGESMDIDNFMNVDPSEFALPVVLGNRRYACIAPSRLLHLLGPHTIDHHYETLGEALQGMNLAKFRHPNKKLKEIKKMKSTRCIIQRL